MSEPDDPPPAAEPDPRPVLVLGDPDDAIVDLLRAGQALLLKYPLAARAAVRAFAAEGRRFAETPEGQRCKEALEGTELMRRGRLVWEGLSLNLLEESEPTVLPSALLESVLAAAASDRLEALLSRLFLREEDAGAPADP
jgi:hypothetical protein